MDFALLTATSRRSIARTNAHFAQAPETLTFVYRCGRIIKHFADRNKVWIQCVRECHFLSLFLVSLERWTGKTMSDGVAFPHVIINELFHGGQTHSQPTRRDPCS